MTHIVDNLTAESQVFAKWYRTSPLVVPTSAGTYALTASTEGWVIFTGSTAGQIVTLGAGTTYQTGQEVCLHNASTQSIAVRYNDGSALTTLMPTQRLWLFMRDNATQNGTWDYHALQDARQAYFDKASNGFDASTVQSAVEEIDFRTLTAEPTGMVDRTTCTMAFNNSTRTFTITPVGSFSYYIRGHRYTKSAPESIQITNTEGVWYIYYSGSTLAASQTEWKFNDPIVFLSIIYWDVTNATAIFLSDERHGTVMDWATHESMHRGVGMRAERNNFMVGNYTLNQDGTQNAHAQFSLTSGILHDEDLAFTVTNSATPTNPFEQKLSPISWLPIYYQSGTPGTWRKLTATAYAFGQSGAVSQYNLKSGSTWSLANVTTDYYFVTWIFATNNQSEPIVGIMGQNQYTDPLLADAAELVQNLDLTGLPFAETLLLYRCMYRYSTTYTNAPKTVLINIVGINTPSSLAQAISNKRLTSTTAFQTNSTTDAVITGFTITPDAGTYAVFYSADIQIGVNNALMYSSIYLAGTKVTDSERRNQGVGSNFATQTNTLTTISVNGSQAVDVRVRVSTGTVTVNGRSLVLIRLGG